MSVNIWRSSKIHRIPRSFLLSINHDFISWFMRCWEGAWAVNFPPLCFECQLKTPQGTHKGDSPNNFRINREKARREATKTHRRVESHHQTWTSSGLWRGSLKLISAFSPFLLEFHLVGFFPFVFSVARFFHQSPAIRCRYRFHSPLTASQLVLIAIIFFHLSIREGPKSCTGRGKASRSNFNDESRPIQCSH